MRHPSNLSVAGLLLLLVCGACSVAPNAVFRTEKSNLDKNEFVATDSRLRLATNTQIGAFSFSGQVDPQRIVCTEPSPDVATALAGSFGAGLSVLGYGSVSLSAEQVEGLIQLGERTAAIQLLRDKMYQTCLAYQNGAITGTTYSLIMSRLDDTIVTLSLGDTAGGAFGRSGGAIGTKASAEAEAALTSLPGDLSDISKHSEELATANNKVDAAEKALADTRAAAPQKKADQEQADFDKEKAKHEADVDEKQQAVDKAKGERDALLQLLKSTATTASEAAGEVTDVAGVGGITARPSPLIAAELNEMQSDFMSDDVSKMYISACMVELGMREGVGTHDERLLTMLSIEMSRLQLEKAEQMAADNSDAATAIELELKSARAAYEQIARRVAENSQTTNYNQLIATLRGNLSSNSDWVDYIKAVLRDRGTALADHCGVRLPAFVVSASKRQHDYRTLRAKLSAEVDMADSDARALEARKGWIQVRQDSLKNCAELFKDDAESKKRCIDGILAADPMLVTAEAAPSSN